MRRLISYSAALGVILAASACGGSGSGSSSDDAAPTAEEADTEAAADAPVQTGVPRTDPPVSIPEVLDAGVLLDLLPVARDLGPLELGIPTVAAIRVMANEVSTDPKGPCGAPVTLPPLDAAAGRTYDTVKGRIVAIAIPRDEAVDAYLEANKADLTAGCASHTTTIADGTELTLSTPEAVDVSSTTPEGVAWTSTIEQPTPSLHRATLMLPSPELAMFVTMTSPEPFDPAYVQQMASVYFDKVATAA